LPRRKGKHPVEQVVPLLMGQQVVESEYGLSVDLQEKLRQEGQSAPWMKIGRRIFYLRAEFTQWLEEQKAKTMAPGAKAPEPKAALTLGDDTLAAALDQIIRTTPMGDETRKRIAELLGGDNDAA
jgi:hypothetical protein